MGAMEPMPAEPMSATSTSRIELIKALVEICVVIALGNETTHENIKSKNNRRAIVQVILLSDGEKCTQ